MQADRSSRMSFVAVVGANDATALWHVYVLHMLRPTMSADSLLLLASFITAVCATAIVLSWTGYRKTAGGFLVGYAILGLTTGGYARTSWPRDRRTCSRYHRVNGHVPINSARACS